MSEQVAFKAITDFQPEFFHDTITDFRVGNSRFNDDLWNFSGFYNEEGLTPARYQIRFMDIKHPQIKLVAKQFVIYDLVMNSFPTAKRDFDGFRKFYKYLVEFHPQVDSLSKLNRIVVAGYFQYLLDSKSYKTGESLSRTGLFKSSQIVKNILLEGSKAGWEVPKDVLWIRVLYREMIENSPRTKLNRKTSKKQFKQETIEKIISCALKDEDIITKTSIIIQSQVGFRINELLALKAGCMKLIDGKWFIEYVTKKTKKEPVLKQNPANQLVADVVKELEEKTEELRKESGSDYLFLRRVRFKDNIRVFDKGNWNRDIEYPFVQRWDIREDGELILLSSHYYRHIFATWAHRKGMRIESILKMFDHSSLAMTEVYTYLNKEDMKAMMTEIFSEKAKIAGVSVGRIKERLKNNNPFKGKTQEQIEMIMNAMRINIRPNGVCFHHPARNESCAGDGDCVSCSNFVSSAIFLPVHKERVKKLEAEMERANNSGNTVWYDKNKSLREHIVKVFINPLEAEIKM